MAYPKANVDFTKDPGTTGNFEITVNDAPMFSKKGGDGFPHKDWEAFATRLKNQVEA